MKKLLFIFLLVFAKQANAQTYVKIPDANFATYLHTIVAAAMHGDSLDTTSALVTTTTHTFNVNAASISDLSGIKYFTSLKALNCNDNSLKALPALPNSLVYIDCSYNYNLTNLSALPSSLVTLWCQDDSLVSLPALPASLKTLWCFNNYLTTLPALPVSLQTLYCYNNVLTDLPALNNALTRIDCYYNLISSFPAMPNSLTYVDCHNNTITNFSTLGNSLTDLYSAYNNLISLPALPATLINLDCSFNQLTNLPALPDGLSTLTCSYNQLTSLPNLPNLTEFYCDSNNITCFPVLPNSLEVPYYNVCIRAWDYYLNISSNPFTCVPNFVDAMGPDTLTYIKCTPGNVNSCSAAGINPLSANGNQISVYPNPSNGVFTIETNSTAKQTVQLFDVTGKLVLSQIINDKTIVDASFLSEGIYNMTVTSNEGVVNKHLVIIR